LLEFKELENHVRVCFADCTLDTDARRLERGGAETHLSPKAFEVLRLLVETRPRALSKAELLDRVWPDVFVTDASLARVITEIRGVIGDRARDGHIVRTVHGYGYAFAAELEAESKPANATAHPICWLIDGRREVGLPNGEHILGREPTAAVWLDSPRVSRHHARIIVNDGSATIEDLESKNGSFIGGVRVTAPTPLRPGNTIRIGPFTLIFKIAVDMASTETDGRSWPPD
jgi:DNA-binding winged helix-turn-helix (wHTH) protein